MIKGTDISQWQGDVDFTKLKAVTDFVIIKATEGYGFTDKKFLFNQTGARKAGILMGYYIYTRPDLGNTVEAEVDYLLKTIGELKKGELIALDYEVSYSRPVAWCKSWFEYLSKKLNGYKGIVYLNQSLLNGNDWTPVINAGHGLWLAKYDYIVPKEMPSTKWGTCAFQQYSNREVVAGIPTAVDANVFFGNKDAYIKYGYNPDIAPEIPDPCEEVIRKLESQLAVLGNDIINLTSSLNGANADLSEMEDKYASDINSKIQQIESLQKTNAEMTAQLSLMSGQARLLVDEKNALQVKLEGLQGKLEEALELNVTLSSQVTDLKAKLKKGLLGYTKRELFRAWLLGR